MTTATSSEKISIVKLLFNFINFAKIQGKRAFLKY